MSSPEDDTPTVVAALEATTSVDSTTRKPAEDWLNAAEASSSTHLIALLMRILKHGNGVVHNPQTRQIAALLLKNVLKRRWAREVEPSEKPELREALITLLASETDASKTAHALSGGLAVVSGEDFPHAWPGLIASLVNGLKLAESGGLEGGMLRCTSKHTI